MAQPPSSQSIIIPDESLRAATLWKVVFLEQSCYKYIKYGERNDTSKTPKKILANNQTKSNITVLNKLLSFFECNELVTGILEIEMTYHDQYQYTYDTDGSWNERSPDLITKFQKNTKPAEVNCIDTEKNQPLLIATDTCFDMPALFVYRMVVKREANESDVKYPDTYRWYIIKSEKFVSTPYKVTNLNDITYHVANDDAAIELYLDSMKRNYPVYGKHAFSEANFAQALLLLEQVYHKTDDKNKMYISWHFDYFFTWFERRADEDVKVIRALEREAEELTKKIELMETNLRIIKVSAEIDAQICEIDAIRQENYRMEKENKKMKITSVMLILAILVEIAIIIALT